MRTLPVGDVGRREACAELTRGEMVVLPTDTVYGIAVLATLPGADARLADAKGRDARQPIAVLVAGIDQVEEIAAVDDRIRALARAFWPGPLTMVIPRRAAVSLDLGQPTTTIGVRCPDSAFVVDLAREVGPLAVTSANQHGAATPDQAEDAAACLETDVGLAIDGGVLGGVPSTVADLTAEAVTIARVGTIAAAEIDAVLRSLGNRN